jgi:hypothetical protein
VRPAEEAIKQGVQMKQGISFLIAVVAVLALSASIAAAAGSNTKVTISASMDFTALEGKVKSSKPNCVEGRKVNLFYDEPQGDKDFAKVGSDKSDPDGSWHVDGPVPMAQIPDGHYYAKVKAAGSCDKDKSPTITVKSI